MFIHMLGFIKTRYLILFVSACLIMTFSYAENTHVSDSASSVKALLATAKKYQKSDVEKSQSAAEKAYQAVKQTPNDEQEVQALLLLAKIAKQKKQHYVVQKYLTKIEALLSKIDNISLSMQAYTFLAKVEQSLKKYQSSLHYSEKFLALAESKKDNKQLYLGYRFKGQTLKRMKSYHAALQTFLLAETYTLKLSNYYKFQAQWNLVVIYGSLNDHSMRIAYINKGIIVLNKSNNLMHELPKALNQLARSQRHLHQYESAIINAKKANLIAREQKNKAMQAFSAVTLSRIYRWLGSYDNALIYCREAVDIYKVLGDVNGFASAANALGLIYKHLEQTGYAIDYHQQVLALPLNKINPKYLGAALRELAQHYFNIGKKDEALVLIKQAYDVYKKAKSVKGRASVQKIMGKFYFEIGDNAAALTAYKKAIEYSNLSGDAWNEAETLILIGILKTDTSIEEAKQSTLKGLTIAKNIKVKWIMEQAYTALIDIEEKSKNHEAVKKYSALKAQIQANIEQERIQKDIVNAEVLKKEKASELVPL